MRFVRGVERVRDDDLLSQRRRAAREAGEVPPPRGERLVEASVETRPRFARGKVQLGPEPGLRPAPGEDGRLRPPQRGAVSVPAVLRLPLAPLGALAHGDAAKPIPDLPVARERKHPARHSLPERGREVVPPGARAEEVEGHGRRPAVRALEREVPPVVEPRAVADEPLRLVGHVGLEVHQPVALDAGVVVPGRAPERRAVDRLEQVVRRPEVDRGLVGARVEPPEQLPRGRDPGGQPGDRLVPEGHDVHRDRPARGHPLEVRKRRAVGQPRLVREHVEPRRVQPRDRAELGLVAAGEDDGPTAPLLDERPLGVGGLVDLHCPVGRVGGAGVEGADQGDERVALRAGGRVEVDAPVHAGVPDPQGEGRVEMAGFEEEQGVHGAYGTGSSPARLRRPPARDVGGRGVP